MGKLSASAWLSILCLLLPGGARAGVDCTSFGTETSAAGGKSRLYSAGGNGAAAYRRMRGFAREVAPSFRELCARDEEFQRTHSELLQRFRTSVAAGLVPCDLRAGKRGPWADYERHLQRLGEEERRLLELFRSEEGAVKKLSEVGAPEQKRKSFFGRETLLRDGQPSGREGGAFGAWFSWLKTREAELSATLREVGEASRRQDEKFPNICRRSQTSSVWAHSGASPLPAPSAPATQATGAPRSEARTEQGGAGAAHPSTGGKPAARRR